MRLRWIPPLLALCWGLNWPTVKVIVGSLPPAMWASFWPGLGALALVALGLFAVRARQLILEGELDEAYVRLEDSRS